MLGVPLLHDGEPIGVLGCCERRLNHLPKSRSSW
jgi:hypothetical protein